MGGSLANNNPVIVAAFHDALRRQGLLVLLFLLLALAAWACSRLLPPRSSEGGAGHLDGGVEPAARRVLRIGFGMLWIVDGLLQTQQSMPVGLPTGVVSPAAATSPIWVRHLVGHGLSIWLRHPIPAATASVWIQIGIGALLLFAPRGWPSRAAGALSVGWGLAVWVFAEAFGGIFAPGASWMFGAPGAALVYALAGGLVTLPDRSWARPRVGRRMLRALGLFLVGMAVLQAWPGRGSWQGGAGAHRAAGALDTMVTTMTGTPQPAALTSLLQSFASVVAAHGFAVNLVVVTVLGLCGAGLLVARRGPSRAALGLLVAVSLADWVLVQDLGVLGGLGTDPNSMLPLLLLAGGGYLALTRPARAEAMTTATAPASTATVTEAVEPATASGGRPWPRPGLPGLATAAGLFGVLLVGAVPMAVATANPRTDAIVSEGLNGQPQITDTAASPFHLVDQYGAAVSLSSLRGRTVALTFLDPVCTSDCPLIAQDLRQTDTALADPAGTAFVAVVANPIYRAREFTQAFDAQEGLTGLANWYFVTGSLAQLRQVWDAYGIEVQTVGSGGMVAHDDTAYIIDRHGRLRAVLGSDPGDGSTSTASLTTLLEQQVRAAEHP